jgi:hypothetical protein
MSPTRASLASAPRLPNADQRIANGQTWDLPVPAQGASTHARFFDPAGPPSLAISCLAVLPSAFETASAPGNYRFRGSMAGLCPPLPTLRRRPCERQRSARGRCGSLRLHRVGLSPTTPCRSPGALRIRYAQPCSRSPRYVETMLPVTRT